MAVDLIKQYLIGIGFNVDESSLSKTEKGMDRADKKVKEFNRDSKKGFSETSDSLRSLFKLLGTGEVFEKIFPGMKGPLIDLIKGIIVLKQLFKEIKREKPDFEVEQKEVKKDDKQKNKKPSKKEGKVEKKKEEHTREKSKSNESQRKPKVIKRASEILKPTKGEKLGRKQEQLQVRADTEKPKKETEASIKKPIGRKLKNTKYTGSNPKEESKKVPERKQIEKGYPKENKSENPKRKPESTEKIKREVHEVKREDVIRNEKIKRTVEFDSKVDKVDIPKVEVPKIEIPEVAEGVKKQLDILGGNIKGFIGNINDLQGVIKSLLVRSSVAIGKFVSAAKGPIGVLVVATTAAIGVVKKLGDALTDMAKKDIEYEKLARQLWTTKDNARDVDMALKTLGASIEDLHMSPTLLKQFNQLRKDSKELRLPPEYKENMQLVQGVVFEFKRLKQLVTQFFQWVGHYILKYVKGPLNEIKQGMGKFNNTLIKVIPKIAKGVGMVLGFIINIISAVGKVVGAVIKVLYNFSGLKAIVSIITKGVQFLKDVFDSIPGPLQDILKIIGLIGIAMMMGPVGAVVLLILALEDLVNFFTGKRSFLGKLLGIDPKDDEEDLRPNIDGNGTAGSTNALNNINDKVAYFDQNMNTSSSGSSAPQSYVTNNAQTSTSNNTTNNKVDNNNTINIYGTDPVATGRAVEKNLGSIQSRNLQGVY